MFTTMNSVLRCGMSVVVSMLCFVALLPRTASAVLVTVTSANQYGAPSAGDSSGDPYGTFFGASNSDLINAGAPSLASPVAITSGGLAFFDPSFVETNDGTPYGPGTPTVTNGDFFNTGSQITALLSAKYDLSSIVVLGGYVLNFRDELTFDIEITNDGGSTWLPLAGTNILDTGYTANRDNLLPYTNGGQGPELQVTISPVLGSLNGVNGLRFTIQSVDGFQDDYKEIDVFGTLAQAEAVPEPSTFVLAALGLAGLGLVAWRKRK